MIISIGFPEKLDSNIIRYASYADHRYLISFSLQVVLPTRTDILRNLAWADDSGHSIFCHNYFQRIHAVFLIHVFANSSNHDFSM